MLRLLTGPVAIKRSMRMFSAHPVFQETKEWGVFPNEKEGNNYWVNWSLTVDGITPVGSAFRNAKLQTLASRLPAKIEGGKVELKSPIYIGEYKLTEAGDSVTIDDFQAASEKQVEHFESGIEMFVEDAGLGSHFESRAAVRVITDNAASALIARSLLIAVPPRDVDHRARFNGWNHDERWAETEVTWKGSSYEINDAPTFAAKGERPIVAVYGGAGSAVSVQFVESSGKIVGANVMLGGSAPVRAFVDALGHATCVYINEQSKDSLALASLSFSKDKGSVVVIGADDSVLMAIAGKPSLHGAYHNILTTAGVSAVWNGYIGEASLAGDATPPAVVVGGLKAVAVSPYNLIAPVSQIVFYEKGAKKSDISEADAIAKIVALTDESKTELIGKLLKGVKVSIIGSVADVSALL